MFVMWWQANVNPTGVRPPEDDHYMYVSNLQPIMRIHLYENNSEEFYGQEWAYVHNYVNAFGEQIGEMPDWMVDRPNVSLWELMNNFSGRIYGNEDLDIPRYKMIEATGELNTQYSYTTQFLMSVSSWGGNTYYDYQTVNGAVVTYNKNWNSIWNGVSSEVWNNTGDWFGEDGAWMMPWSNTNPENWNDWSAPDGQLQTWKEYSGEPASVRNKWQRIFCNQLNWWVHFTEPIEFGGRTYDRGSLFPTKHVLITQTGWDTGGVNNGLITYKWDLKWAGNQYRPGGILTEEAGAVALSDGIPGLTDDKRLGVVYSLEDSGASDLKSDSCVTEFMGKFSYTPVDVPDVSARLKILFL